jgi:hypothetical protein
VTAGHPRVRSRRGGETDENDSKASGEHFKKKVLARWRWLARQGTSLEQAALEIGVAVTELRAWSQEESSAMPLIVPVYVEGEATRIERGGLVAVLAGGVRVEGLTIADVVELARRLS